MPVCTDEHAHTLANTCTHTRNPHPTPHTQPRARTHAPPLTHTQTRSHAHTHTRKQAHTHTHSHTHTHLLEVSVHAGVNGQAVLVGACPFRVHPRAPDPRALLKGLDGEEGLTLGQVSHGTQPRRSRSYHRHSDRHSHCCSKLDFRFARLVYVFFRLLPLDIE